MKQVVSQRVSSSYQFSLLATALASLLMLLGVRVTQARVEVDAGQDYTVTPKQGPWMICAASYTGTQAFKFSHDLVLEIRQTHQLPAYLFNYGAEKRKKQEEEIAKKREERRSWLLQNGYDPNIKVRIPHENIEDQCAVLIGGYNDIDDARSALDKIKKLQAPKSVPRDLYFSGAPDGLAQNDSKDVKKALVNPFATSFVVRNPTVPMEKNNQPDPFLKDLNADESFSLLKNKHRWTLVIKSFQGGTVLQPQSAPNSFMDKLFGHSSGEQLSQSAYNAHQLAEGLRKVKLETYVLHTRASSIVTVGGFESPDDPGIEKTKEFLRTLKLERVQLMANPLPMEVPNL